MKRMLQRERRDAKIIEDEWTEIEGGDEESVCDGQNAFEYERRERISLNSCINSFFPPFSISIPSADEEDGSE